MMYYLINRQAAVIIGQSTNYQALKNFRRRLAAKGYGIKSDYLIGHYLKPTPVLDQLIDNLTFEHNLGFKG